MGQRSPEALSGQSHHENCTGRTWFLPPLHIQDNRRSPLSQEYERLRADTRSRFAPPVRTDARWRDARGNPVRIRGCPAAVSGNESRRCHWVRVRAGEETAGRCPSFRRRRPRVRRPATAPASRAGCARDLVERVGGVGGRTSCVWPHLLPCRCPRTGTEEECVRHQSVLFGYTVPGPTRRPVGRGRRCRGPAFAPAGDTILRATPCRVSATALRASCTRARRDRAPSLRSR